MDRKTRLPIVNSKIDVEWEYKANWRQQQWLTYETWKTLNSKIMLKTLKSCRYVVPWFSGYY